MLQSVSRARMFAAGAAALAFVATFSVSARAMIEQDAEVKRTYIVVSVENPTSDYKLNQRIEQTVSATTPPETMEIEPGVFVELVDTPSA